MISRRRFIATPLISIAASKLAACHYDTPLNQTDIAGSYLYETMQRGHYLRDLQTHSFTKNRIIRTGCIIAGAGVAGLSAARQLNQIGRDDFIVLELANTSGGNARGAAINGIVHPLGAHYLPAPNDSMSALQSLLEELNIRKRISGRWVYDEAFLCHSPQERLFFQGQWQQGLLPLQGVPKNTLLQYQRFSELVAIWRKTKQFNIPNRHNIHNIHTNNVALFNLHTLTFAQYLNEHGLNDVHLLWYLDYCCRDDYGSDLNTVSAWAGIHYFAARHGFNLPYQASNDDALPVLTWPQGNAFLTQALSKPLLNERLKTDRIVVRIEVLRNRVEVDVLNVLSQQLERYEAPQAIVALPAFIASRVIVNPSKNLVDHARAIQYSAWSVANIWCDTNLRIDIRTAGNAPDMAWDNVIYKERSFSNTSLGYVNASHQNTAMPKATVLTHYSTYGTSLAAKKSLLALPWQQARNKVLQELSQVHGDIYEHAKVVNITRYGHAMATPVPRTRQNMLFLTQPAMPKLQFAHSDWVGYSIFEEAFEQGFKAANFMA
jgi:predicted NAD/FAD-binding protein